jgi:hypothetical protein
MASPQVQQAPGHSTTFNPIPSGAPQPSTQKYNVQTTLNYYLDLGDGSPPAPTYVGKPETYERPAATTDVTVHDIRGEEDQYTLDSHGFQLYRYPSLEKDFLDDEKIKREYYAEVEKLLKEAYVSLPYPRTDDTHMSKYRCISRLHLRSYHPATLTRSRVRRHTAPWSREPGAH